MKKILMSVMLIMFLVSISYAQEVGFARKARHELIYIGSALHSCRVMQLPPNPCNPTPGCPNNEVEVRDAAFSIRNIDPNDSIKVKVTLYHFDPRIKPGDPYFNVLNEWPYAEQELAPFQSYGWSTYDFGWQPWTTQTSPTPNCPPIKICLIPNFSSPEYGRESGYFLLEWWSVSGKKIIAPTVGGMTKYQDSTGIRDSYGYRPVVIYENLKSGD
jgi:hypothetical protein